MKTFFAGLILACVVYAAPETELKDSMGKTIVRYVVEPPASPSGQLGLILCSAEHDRPTGDEILPVREALLRLGIRDQYVLLAGHSQAQKFSAADDEPIGKLLRWAMTTYSINPRRVYMYGKGEGGKISAEFAMLHPDLITASITYSWGWWRMPSEIDKPIDMANSAPEIYMVLGLRDLSYHLTTVRDAYLRTSAKGYHVIYREFDDLGARTYHPASNQDALAWATSLRNKNLPLSAEERVLLARPQRVNSNGYFSDLALVGGIPAAPLVQKLLDSPDPDTRAAAARTCVHAVFDEATVEALARKATDPSVKVRRAAFQALAVNANWRSAAAQHALIEIALNPAKAIAEEDRATALDGIAAALRYQLRGAPQDPQLFKAVVTLLKDENEELRTMAANILAPVRDPGFRGDLGRPEQKEPAGGWDHWLDTMTAQAEGYRHDYAVCATSAAAAEPVATFCKGAQSQSPAERLSLTRQAAEQGYVPAEAQLGMLYAIGKGVPQNWPEALNWWLKAAEGGHLLAAQSTSMIYRGGAGIRGDQALSQKWAQYVIDHTPAN